MPEPSTSRRRFLRAAPPVIALTAGCQAPSSRPTDARPTDARPTDGTTPADDAGTPVTPDVLDYHPRRARVVREFLPHAGPASIAVGFPLDRATPRQAYCFDAGACRLRYAWAGGFVSISYTKDDGPATLDGQIYYRPQRGFPLRFGAVDRRPDAVAFRGYSLVDRLPAFRYAVDGVAVRHLVRPARDGRGLRQTFEITDPGGPVWYVPGDDDALSFDASAGEWRDGRLRVDASEAAALTVTVGESA